MAVVKTPQESQIGIKVANGTSASGAAQFKTLRFSNVKPAAVDQDLFDVGASIGALQGAALVAIIRTDTADLSNE
jgi:hypothetical protein